MIPQGPGVPADDGLDVPARPALRWIVENDGSDLHLKVKTLPLARINGSLRKLEQWEVLQEEDTERVVQEMLGDHEDEPAEFAQENKVDFSYAIPGPRSLPRQRLPPARHGLGRHARDPLRREDGPRALSEIADEERGLILLTGTTGSGKSTTLAAIIDHINETRNAHIVTIEDPIEYLHKDRNSIINQREVGMTPPRSAGPCAASCARTRT